MGCFRDKVKQRLLKGRSELSVKIYFLFPFYVPRKSRDVVLVIEQDLTFPNPIGK